MFRLGGPLPWMIGPMVVIAFAFPSQIKKSVPRITRPIGQVIVGSSVGLFFTPAAAEIVKDQIVPMVVVAFLTIGAGFLAAAVLMRFSRVDSITACLACIPGGPVEMAVLAERYDVLPGPVAFAQILRIALLVLIVPPLISVSEGGIEAMVLPIETSAGYPGAILLLPLVVCGAFFMKAIRIPIPFLLGPIAAAAISSALMIPVSAPPYFVLAAAQILLGVWLGCMFDKRLLMRAGRLVPAIFVSTAALLLICALMALAISAMTGIRWQTMVLATAPGSVTEMALTAKMFQEGVALVTAFHVLRIFILIPSAPVIFSLMAKRAK